MKNNYTSNEYFKSKEFNTLVNAFIKKFPNIDREDIYSIAAEGVLKTADKFIPDKGLAFETFAYRKIYWLCLHYLEDNKEWKNVIIGPADKTINNKQAMWETATKEDTELLELRFLYRYNIREIAQILNTDPKTVKERLQKLIKKLKKVYYT